MTEPTTQEAFEAWYFDTDDENDFADPVCQHCDGDGRDRYSDYLLPCPHCQGEQTP